MPPHRVEVPTVNQAAYDPLGINEPLAAPPVEVPEATSSTRVNPPLEVRQPPPPPTNTTASESIVTTILNESDPRKQEELFNALLPKLAWDAFTSYFNEGRDFLH